MKFLTNTVRTLLKKNFPDIPMCIAYGSGVFKQKGYGKNDAPMIDMIFVIENTSNWHRENLKRNPQHYSFLLRLLGPAIITKIQRNFGAKIYYHPFIKLTQHLPAQQQQQEESAQEYAAFFYNEKQEYKYGTIDVQDFLEDLNNWTTLYCSGRLHKPVLLTFQDGELSEQGQSTASSASADTRSQLIKAYEYNLAKAFDCARLLLPERFTEKELYLSICGISYMGDIRTKVVGGENVNKVENIVHANFKQFHELYLPLLKTIGYNDESGVVEGYTFHQDKNNKQQIADIIRGLPPHLLQVMKSKVTTEPSQTKGGEASPDDWIMKLVESKKEKSVLESSLHDIVAQSSTSQSFKGIISAGLTKSAVYAWQKFKKGIKSKM